MIIRFAIFVAAVLLFLPSAICDGKDRTVDEFRQYALRRIVMEDELQLAAFVESVDANSDGVISDEEFANRIEVFQRVFKTIHPVPGGGGHELPENWLTDFDKAKEAAAESGKPIVAMFSASWCGPCKMMIANVYPTDEAIEALESFVPVYIDSEKQVELATENNIQAYPTYVCFDPNGEAIGEHIGGGSVEDFVAMLAEFQQAVSQ